MLTSKVLTNSAAYLSRRFASNKVAVVLSGSGVYDGSEIHEASACLSHLTRHGIEPVCFAPDREQMHAVDHASGNPSAEKRNVLSESARIARGKIQSLSALRVQDVDAIVFPGGFGVAKNLSTFAVDGPNCQVDPLVEQTIKEFVSAKKPLAFCCIAPILAARVISGVKITLGMDKDDGNWPYAGSVEAVQSWGAKHENCTVSDVCVDETNLVVTTPAFMYNTEKFHEIYDGVGLMIAALKKLMK
ncbi:ES1 protein homolog, mitochondrial [Galendromus occidentalis]|uniref:ES1 protein homolog, mitochondrial n=1 Tax=Galendromus occidentalis TaxID=34638 RepID=A0AAJ6QR63_9ACAR|nr:ES1 protein homolog, mitochondrial [Galendromus occidentalis]